MRAEKGNKEYVIGETQVTDYQNQGYDIYDDDGKIIAYGKGKTVPYEEYMALKTQNQELEKKIQELQEPAEEKKELPKKKAGA